MVKKESIVEAARFFLTAGQMEKNQLIDKVFVEQPSIVTFLEYLNKAVDKEETKEVILQLMMISYLAISLQKIKIKKIPFDDFMDSLSENTEMKSYFHNPSYKFDGESFKTFYETYPQKELLNYTYFAINNQFDAYVKNEQDALFIFYTMKVLGDVIDKNIKK